MSRKTVKWRQVAEQCGFNADRVTPHRTQGKGTCRADELDEWQRERASNTICCRPMGDEKLARFVRLIGTEGNVPKAWHR